MKAKVLILTIIAITLSCLFAGCAGQPAQPTPAPTPPSPPRTLPPFPVEFIEMDATTAKSYLPGEEVVIEFSFKNITDEPFEIDPFPPDIEIVGGRGADELVRLFPAGTETKSLEPGEVASYTLTWDQRDDQGQQVDYGCYWLYITGGGTLVDKALFDVFILPPEGVMEKTIEVNKSQTVNGVTFILERVQLTACGVMFVAFNADYRLDEDPETPPPPMDETLAEHSFGGGGTREADSPSGVGGGSELEGAEYVWDWSDPVPNGTKELTFTITKFGDQEGPWEFHIPLH